MSFYLGLGPQYFQNFPECHSLTNTLNLPQSFSFPSASQVTIAWHRVHRNRTAIFPFHKRLKMGGGGGEKKKLTERIWAFLFLLFSQNKIPHWNWPCYWNSEITPFRSTEMFKFDEMKCCISRIPKSGTRYKLHYIENNNTIMSILNSKEWNEKWNI